MSKLNLKQIEENILPLGGQDKYSREFIFDLLTAYGRSSSNITRLRNGSFNVANNPDNEVAQKNVVYFKPVNNENLYAVIDELKSDSTVVRYSTRFVIVTDYKQLLAIDTKTNETLDIEIKDIDKHFTFFLPWAGMEKAQYVAENHADIKAAYKMAKLFDEIVSFNHHVGDVDYYHSLNVFFSRLLFCFFAEDTEIFNKNQFTASIESHTQTDGSDLAEYLDELFFALDAEDEDKEGYPAHIASFPYVNGGLFHAKHKSPKFNTKARELILECGKLDWSNINPDIFGSMIQAVVNPGQRAGLGMHYTSVPNIMKTIEPLFLNELKEEFNKHYDDNKKLQQLLNRVGKIKIFDPACGSGNFLVIAYKELRRLEHAILQRQGELGVTNAVLLSHVNIENFYGIEIDDFAHQVAILSLWLAKHQMNIEFKQKFGVEISLIPLNETGNIVHGNAARLDWNSVCPNNKIDEIYIIGNPPYLGQRNQQDPQKADLAFVFQGMSYYKKLDYVACWFMLACRYLSDNVKIAFISTSSINQGVQIEQLWPRLFKFAEICFAYTPFRWTNSAKDNAGVICVVVGLQKPSNHPKFIFSDGLEIETSHINAYLIGGRDVFVGKTKASISGLPKMVSGCQPREGGYLMLSPSEREELILNDIRAGDFILPMVGSDEFVRNTKRYCIWIEQSRVDEALQIPGLKTRIEKVREKRINGNSVEKTFASVPYRFVTNKRPHKNQIIIPTVSTDSREYIPIGILDRETIVNSRAYCIYDAEPWVLGLLISKMHQVWVKTVAGRLGNAINYSSHICYNTFPVPALANAGRQAIEAKTFDVLDAREHHSEQTLAELYNPEKMPEDLRTAHRALDEAVDQIYRKRPFENDEERLSHLFNLYEQMIAKEKEGAIACPV